MRAYHESHSLWRGSFPVGPSSITDIAPQRHRLPFTFTTAVASVKNVGRFDAGGLNQ